VSFKIAANVRENGVQGCRMTAPDGHAYFLTEEEAQNLAVLLIVSSGRPDLALQLILLLQAKAGEAAVLLDPGADDATD